jgi:hypothetical protein
MLFVPATREALGRSYNIQYVHASEFCFWEDMGRKKIDPADKLTALRQSVVEAPATAIILESTPNGMNKSYQIWTDAVKGLNGFRAVFLPWVAYETYRLPLRVGEAPELSASETLAGLETRYGDERREERVIREQLKDWYSEEYERWGEPWLEREVMARLNWRRFQIDNACNGDKKMFRREYSTLPEDGFAATGKNAFDPGSLELMLRHVKEEGIEPRRFSYAHDPDDADMNTKFVSDPYGAITVHEFPQADSQYVLAGDPARGVQNGDPSSLIVMKVPDMVEVASFNKVIEPDIYGHIAYWLGRLYNNALIGIECNELGGEVANRVLYKDLAYPRLYRRFDLFDKKAAPKPGFNTNKTNKGVLVSDLNALLREHAILFRTPLIIEQLQSYSELDNGELGAVSGHDDLVSAAMIAVHLSQRVHAFPPRVEPPGPGTVGYERRKQMQRRSPSLLGRR